MYITGIRFRTAREQSVKGWKFNPGSSKLRNVSVLSGEREDMENVAQAVNFALSGKREQGLSEVWLDAADDAGDIWTIERGQKGSNFRRNGKLLSLEEAQRSILASLLDLDASLNQVEGLVTSVDIRQIIARGSEVAATTWDPNGRNSRTDVPSIVAARELAAKLAGDTGLSELQDPRKLARIAGPSARLLGAFDELNAQMSVLSETASQDRGDQNLESVQAELDLLNQIDQNLRRVHEGGESFSKLATLLDTLEQKISSIRARWSQESLVAVANLKDPGAIIDLLIKCRAWGKFYEHLTRLKTLSDDQIAPLSGQGLKIWDDYLAGSRSNGQEIESCLASMLLGLKQMSHEVDRYVSQSAQSAASAAHELKGGNWFDRFKGHQAKVTNAPGKSAQVGTQFQKDWVARLARDVESVKVATEYALQSSQSLSEKVLEFKNRNSSESAAFAGLSVKAAKEYERLNMEWERVSGSLGLDAKSGIERVVGLLRDGIEYALLSDAQSDLKVRVEDRISIQQSLEGLIRQWWDMNGSQKTTDLSNLSFLVVEAKAALRYRDGRRQRLKKGLEEISAELAKKDIRQFVESRLSNIARDWNKMLALAELPEMDISSGFSRLLVESGNRCAALLDMSRVEESERFAAASLWPSRLDSAVVAYLWPDVRVPAPQRSNFIKNILSFTGQGEIPVLLLLEDHELSSHLVKAGIGGAMPLSLEDIQNVEGPRREGAVVKSEMKSKRATQQRTVTVSPGMEGGGKGKGPQADSGPSALRARAEAALRILNAKPVK